MKKHNTTDQIAFITTAFRYLGKNFLPILGVWGTISIIGGTIGTTIVRTVIWNPIKERVENTCVEQLKPYIIQMDQMGERLNIIEEDVFPVAR